MIICGLKLTHDGAIALIDGNKLIFSIEMEKINNNLRYTEIMDTSIIEDILADAGYAISDIDAFDFFNVWKIVCCNGYLRSNVQGFHHQQ